MNRRNFLKTIPPLILTGCSLKHIQRNEADYWSNFALGDYYHNLAFDDLRSPKKILKVVKIPEHLVIVQSDQIYNESKKVRGKITKGNLCMTVHGKELNGKIITNPIVLGHEMRHILNLLDKDFHDPDIIY